MNNSPYQFATHAKIVTGDVFCRTSASHEGGNAGNGTYAISSTVKIII